jgi:micrococcal nuclease
LFEYKIVVTRVVDGDTVDAELDLGFQVKLRDRIRLYGLDTPESRTRNKWEKMLGLDAKARLKELIASARPLDKYRSKVRRDIFVRTHKDGKGKFGRILGDIVVNGQSANETLIKEGHGRWYFGGSKGEKGPWVKDLGGIWHRWTEDGYEPMCKYHGNCDYESDADPHEFALVREDK